MIKTFWLQYRDSSVHQVSCASEVNGTSASVSPRSVHAIQRVNYLTQHSSPPTTKLNVENLKNFVFSLKIHTVAVPLSRYQQQLLISVTQSATTTATDWRFHVHSLSFDNKWLRCDFLDPEGSQSATTVAVIGVVVTLFEKCLSLR